MTSRGTHIGSVSGAPITVYPWPGNAIPAMEKMIVKFIYNMDDTPNPHLENVPDGTQHFAEPPKKEINTNVGPAFEQIKTKSGKEICKVAPKLYEALREQEDDPTFFVDDDPAAVKFILEWMDGLLDFDENNAVYVAAETMVKAFVFAERYGFKGFFDSHLQGFVSSVMNQSNKGFVLADAKLIHHVYSETRLGSPVRVLIVDSLAWSPAWSTTSDVAACYEDALLRGVDIAMDLPQLAQDLEAEFESRFSLFEGPTHPFARSIRDITERYKYSAVPDGMWTTNAAFRDAVNRRGQQSGASQFSMVIR